MLTFDCSKCGGKLEKPRIKKGVQAICGECLKKSKRETTRIYDLAHKKSQKRRFG